MFQQVFNPNNLLFRGCAKFFDIVVLSALFCALCLPVVTIGPACAALYYTVVKCIRRGEPDPCKNFFRAFKENFKVGAVSGVMAVVVCGVLWLIWRLLGAVAPDDAAGMVIRTAYQVALVIPLGVAVYLFPILSRFTFGVGGLFATSLKLAVKHLPSTVILVLLHLEVAELSLQYLAPLFVSPALTALVASFFFERIFKKYTPVAEPVRVEKPAPAHPNMDDLPPEEEAAPETPWYLK